METLSVPLNILKVALGLGFVIFLHELGHFLLAKWNGVKVERFSIGFGPTLASFRRGVGLRIGTGSRAPGPGDPPEWGETEYVLAALPLGGYVKMLGENADDAPEGEPRSADPRAYHNKSVWARMQIITAGVIMNVILGLVCFSFVYSQGVNELAARLGGVLPGSPAYKAGLRAGDEIVAIDGRRDVGFKDLMSRVNLSGAGQVIAFTIHRPGSEGEKTLSIEPVREPSRPLPTIGVTPSASLTLADKTPFLSMPGQTVDPAKPLLGFEGNDTVVAVGPEGGPLVSVASQHEFIREVDRFRDRPLVVEVERKKSEGEKSTARTQVTVPRHSVLDFGFRLGAGPVTAIRPDSPAAKAGLKVGDRIVAFHGNRDFDPMRLPDDAHDLAGQSIKLTIERPAEGKPASTVETDITPDASPTWFEPFGKLAPLDVPGLGLALAIEPEVRAVTPDSPAAKAGIQVGDKLRSAILKPAKALEEKSNPKPITVELDGKPSGWPWVFNAVQDIPMISVELTTDKTSKPITVTPVVDPSRFHPSRGLVFETLMVKTPPLGFSASIRRGWEETLDSISSIFRIFQGLAQGRVGGDAFSGVIPIAQIAYSSASMGWTPFIQFLGVLSVNLAVLNFLPIPPLDGGQFVILTAEKVRGRPLPERMINAVMVAGIAFVLGLILLVNGKDVFRLIQSYF